MKGTRGGGWGYREVGAVLRRSLCGLSLFPLIRQPRVQFVDRRLLQVGEQLREVHLRVDPVPLAANSICGLCPS